MKRCGPWALVVVGSSLLACTATPKVQPTGSSTGGSSGGRPPSTSGPSTGSEPPSPAPGGGINLPDASPDMGAAPVTPQSLDMPDAATCGRQDYKLTRLPPELLLVLDRSATMAFAVEGSVNTRWVEVSQAIDEVVLKTQSSVLWGLKMFPTVSGCQMSDEPEVPVALDDHPMMSMAMKGTRPNAGPNGTPMQLAYRKSLAHLKARTTMNPKYLVIGTDGLPNCRNGISGVDDTEGVTAAIREAQMAGVRTFIVGIATHAEGAQAQAALNAMAEAGGTARMMDPKFFSVGNRAELVTALNDITTRISSCVFPLDKAPPNPDEVHVKVGGVKVTRDAVNGWSFGPNMSQILLNGEACEKIKQVKDDNLDIQIIFGCPGLIVN